MSCIYFCSDLHLCPENVMLKFGVPFVKLDDIRNYLKVENK